MKKIIFILLLLGYALVGISQIGVTLIRTEQDIHLLLNYDLSTLSGSDTSFYFSINKEVSKSWAIQPYWRGVTGEGTLALEVTHMSNLAGWIPYYGSLSTTITGTNGAGGWEDTIWGWRYGRLKLTKGTLSAGRLTVVIVVK